jgi:hypothetical protein
MKKRKASKGRPKRSRKPERAHPASRVRSRCHVCGKRLEANGSSESLGFCSYHNAKWRKFMDD